MNHKVSILFLLISLAVIAIPAQAKSHRLKVKSPEAKLDSTIVNPADIQLENANQIVESKVFTIDHWPVVKNDGETAFIIDNLHITLYHIKNAQSALSTQAKADFHLTNNTQNDKGSHKANISLFFIGSAQNILVPEPITIEIQRDTCNPGNPVNAGLKNFTLDIYDQVQSINGTAFMSWTYEGKC